MPLETTGNESLGCDYRMPNIGMILLSSIVKIIECQITLNSSVRKNLIYPISYWPAKYRIGQLLAAVNILLIKIISQSDHLDVIIIIT